ncbi:hypothetical protein [Leptospira ryugenii]|nr:hypothetical protein [Leptospira ryugenii]
MKSFLFFLITFLALSCNVSNASYKQCEQADLNYLTCSLVIYNSYIFCSERASASTGTTDEKAAAKASCDAQRLVGLYYCDEQKKKACGDAKQ